VSRTCLRSDLWLSRLHSCPAIASGVARHLPAGGRLGHRTLAFCGRALRLPADSFLMRRLATRPVRPGLKGAFLGILLLDAGRPGPRGGGGLVALRSPPYPPPPPPPPPRSTFSEVSLRLMWSCGPMALSPLLWAPEVRVYMRSARHARPPPRCPAWLALSFLASRLSPLHWCMAWNGVTPI